MQSTNTQPLQMCFRQAATSRVSNEAQADVRPRGALTPMLETKLDAKINMFTGCCKNDFSFSCVTTIEGLLYC